MCAFCRILISLILIKDSGLFIPNLQPHEDKIWPYVTHDKIRCCFARSVVFCSFSISITYLN